MTKPSAEQDPRVYFAAERTFLAWIRTGLGLMGVGFAVARFGLFLREMGEKSAPVNPHTMSLSVISGVALVAIGVAVNINAVVRHVLVVRELRSGNWVPGEISKSAVVLAVLLAALGVGMALYLLLVR
jgi:putative membrane protein